MPNYYSRARGGLITPPGSTDAYGQRNCSQFNQAYRKTNSYEPSAYSAPPAPMLFQPPMQYNNMPSVSAPGMSRASHYGPIGQQSQTLAPHAGAACQAPRQDRQQDHRRQAPAKQDKVVGGVAQELDYEMDQMTDYVAEMAQEMYDLHMNPHICMSDIDVTRSIMPRSKVTPQFRKFVSGILSSTRLPSSTILLGLNYLSKRMGMLNKPAPYTTTEGQLYRMLTVALLLGSKFLDDNTFQNRSWSEVSGIAVSELNTMESAWLQAISWTLHVNFERDSDFQCWLASWASWREQKNLERSATLERLAPLAPIDHNINRYGTQQHKTYSSPSHQMYGQQRAQRTPPLYQTSSRFDAPSGSRPALELSPPSAPESGPNTPDWMMLPGSGLPPDLWYNGLSSGYGNLYSRRNPQAAYPSYTPAVNPYHYTSHNQYNQTMWTGHPAGCGCSHCVYTSEPYFMSHNYGQQTVAG